METTDEFLLALCFRPVRFIMFVFLGPFYYLFLSCLYFQVVFRGAVTEFYFHLADVEHS